MIPKYTGVWDRGSMWRGDTLLGFSMRIADKDTDVAVVPVSVCAHIVDPFGRKLAELESSIGTDGTVTFARVDGAVFSSEVIPLGGGFHRIVWTGESRVDRPERHAYVRLFITNAGEVSYAGDGDSGAHIFGYQVEKGSFPTSYIPTEGAQVTRVA